jgi:hypothetical protein
VYEDPKKPGQLHFEHLPYLAASSAAAAEQVNTAAKASRRAMGFSFAGRSPVPSS